MTLIGIVIVIGIAIEAWQPRGIRVMGMVHRRLCGATFFGELMDYCDVGFIQATQQ